MRWDDPSLASVLGACLPMENEPLIIVRYKDADLILNLMYKKKVGSYQQTPSQKLASFVYIALMFKVLNYSKM